MAQQVQVTEEQARAVAEESRESGWDKPSFAKELFLGRFPLDLIHPFPRPTDEDAARTDAFLTKLGEFLRGVDGSVIERDAQIPDEYVKGFADLGCFGMKIPVEYGGLGMSQVAYNRALMMVSSVHPSLGALLSAHQSIGVPEPLKLAGTEEQKQKFLPRCAAGGISAFLLTEPDVGSDPARLASTAIPVDDGQAYQLDGVKLWTTNGVVADLLVVMARVPKSEGHRGGISAFVVEADSPGITVERRNKFMGLRGIENGVTRMHRVRVPRENLIGREGDGLKIALTTLNAGRLAIPAIAAGSAKWSLKIAREWSCERVQWGKPVGEHAAVANKIAFIAATAYALESALELSGQMADEGRNDIRIEAALAKLWSSEMACVIADELVQIRGGRGYETAESLAARGERAVPVEQVVRDLRINRIFEGSSEIMRLLIAREAVDAHLSAAGDLANPKADMRQKAKAAAGASGFYAKWLPQLVFGEGQLPTSYRDFGPLATHLRFVERSSRKLARNTFYGMARWQAALEQKQGFLGRVVDIGAELFAMAASCVRAEAQRAADRAEGDQAYELADAFCQQATLRVEALFDALWTNTDGTDLRLARNVLAGRYTWLEEGILDQSEGTGPWIAHWEPGPSTEENVARRFLTAASS
ncbi:acyl-CoA dehydrogenase family protein [Mycobacterium shimoidei]|uniref:Putative acyl-CoA dehydrogenase FadE10 [Mycobacterium tuberculosis H37Rv] n=1 Tax=Mycobacterium shimoidei TaxID=29313 RepID=A0A1E3TE76_MYCSH|nr:acyl-CoA dehydrogenase family protein [Mycobacterium shimoidei]MCV7258432.1 acyl-CoA dehydrogenase family protein [Mycobacterium shimoidei]ODR12678.1 acyl-CoA dehydrogenase [Mycobacterium shimoidei]ORW81784.1 acyl-CoA dehydrogenase [Mycobacterium shimoidei]SRX93776.1 putative acyl-CoA dehydrogenase FadE10 [Mycobacterium tuberculosis H37Rv] [Mycobacterium shimoidei]